MRFLQKSAQRDFFLSLLFSSFISEAIFGYRVIHDHSVYFDYLTWNLVLSWIPFLLAIRITLVLKRKLWSSWEAIILSFLWIVFLPNSFYMISDFIHLQNLSQANIIFDTLMLTSFIYTGVVLGFSSLYLIHIDLKKRMSPRASATFISLTLFISSVAIYFGRDLRWSSWNVFTNPGGLLFDMSNAIAHLSNYPDLIISVVTLFILLNTMYLLVWRSSKLLTQRSLDF